MVTLSNWPWTLSCMSCWSLTDHWPASVNSIIRATMEFGLRGVKPFTNLLEASNQNLLASNLTLNFQSPQNISHISIKISNARKSVLMMTSLIALWRHLTSCSFSVTSSLPLWSESPMKKILWIRKSGSILALIWQPNWWLINTRFSYSSSKPCSASRLIVSRMKSVTSSSRSSRVTSSSTGAGHFFAFWIFSYLSYENRC